MAEEPGPTIIDLDVQFEPATPKKTRAKRAPKAKPEPPPEVVDVDPEPPTKPLPPPLIPPDEVPEGMDPRNAEHVRPNPALTGTVIDPPWEAYKLLLSGRSWHEIAAETGYRTGMDAQRAVEAWMAHAAAEEAPYNRSMALKLSVARHERFLAEWWDKGTVQHDANAGRLVLMALKEIATELRVGEIDAQAGQGGPRIVIAGTEEDYVRGLQGVFAQQNKPHGELPPGRNETIDG